MVDKVNLDFPKFVRVEIFEVDSTFVTMVVGFLLLVVKKISSVEWANFFSMGDFTTIMLTERVAKPCSFVAPHVYVPEVECCCKKMNITRMLEKVFIYEIKNNLVAYILTNFSFICD